MKRTVAVVPLIAAVFLTAPAIAQESDQGQRRTAVPRAAQPRGQSGERRAPAESRARPREADQSSRQGPPQARAEARERQPRDEGDSRNVTSPREPRGRDTQIVPPMPAPAPGPPPVTNERAGNAQRSGAVRRPPPQDGGGITTGGPGVSASRMAGDRPPATGIAVPRRLAPPVGYRGSYPSYSYYRPARAWYPASPRWYYRPYHYDPYGWKHFGWSPLYYVPWSLVWGINTSYFHAHIGFGYPYGYPYPYPYYPAYPAYPYYAPSPPPYGGGSYPFDGRVRLSIRPRDAQVFVDGAYAGIVDDFDGTFQALRLPPGNHKIEVRMPGFETLELDVHVQPDRTITFREDLRPTP